MPAQLRWRALALAPAIAASLALAGPADAKRNLYVSGYHANTVSAFDIASTGALGPVAGSPFSAGNNPSGITLTPDGSRLYTASIAVSAYLVGASGGLSPVTGSPFPAGGAPDGAAITPDGARLYVTSGVAPGEVFAYTINPDGALATVPGSPFDAGLAPAGIAASPSGTHVYVANVGSGTISAYSIGTDGRLTELTGSPFAAGPPALPQQPTAVATSPDGSYLYVTNAAANQISVFEIGPDGAIAETAGSPSATGGATPEGIGVSPDGAYIYVSNYQSDDVSAFRVGAGGALSAVPGSPFAAGTAPRGLAVTPDGAHLHVANYHSNDVSVFEVGSAGGLTPVLGSPYPTGSGPEFQSVTFTPNQGPSAALSITQSVAAPGESVEFDASGSSDPDGEVARYDWDFGDGTAVADGGSSPTHAYDALGTYTATVTVTDNEGCSDEFIFTGQTAHCNGGPGASASRTIAVADTSVSILIALGKLKLKRNRVARVALSCPSSEPSGPCEGKLKLKTRKKVRFATKRAKRAQAGAKRRKRRVVLARQPFEVAAGQTRRVKLRIAKRKARLVRKNRKARKVRAIAKVRDQANNRVTITGNRKLKPQRKGRRGK